MFSLFDEIEEAEEISERTVSASALKEVREAGMAVLPVRTVKYVDKIISASVEYESANDEKQEILALRQIQDAALAIAEGE